jgi:hypothetical protein
MHDPQLPLDTKHMAGISRLLAANDYQRRFMTPLNELREGHPEARNVVWTSNYQKITEGKVIVIPLLVSLNHGYDIATSG